MWIVKPPKAGTPRRSRMGEREVEHQVVCEA